MDKELICRTIINILDVKHCREWEIFAHDDLYDVLYKYLAKFINGNDEAFQDIDKLMARNELIIHKIEKDETISLEQFNDFTEDLRAFKRQYIMSNKK